MLMIHTRAQIKGINNVDRCVGEHTPREIWRFGKYFNDYGGTIEAIIGSVSFHTYLKTTLCYQ